MKAHQIITPGNLRAAQGAGLQRFPHMGPNDIKVWVAALSLNLVKFERVEYDVRLGGAGADLVDREHVHKAMWETLLRKRIDVVGWDGMTPTIVEVKPVGGFAALGQCLGYQHLWQTEKPGAVKPQALCVCAIVDPDLAPTFALYGVRVVSLPADVAASVLEPRPRI